MFKRQTYSNEKAKSHIEYQCIKSMAETEIYMGEKSILKLVLK
jgi:hypothetical protein